MSPARPALLQRLRQGDQAAWERLVDLYSAHLFLWAIRAGLPGGEAVELVRRVFLRLARKLPEQQGSFRTWLRDIAHAQRREMLTLQTVAPGAEAGRMKALPPPASAEVLWEAEYLPSLVRTAIDLMQAEFTPSDWKAVWAVMAEGRPAGEVARELGLSVAAVCAAQGRALRQLREELDGMLD
jgi:RNA polymerase sigma-70 factor (ECF subfamily)